MWIVYSQYGMDSLVLTHGKHYKYIRWEIGSGVSNHPHNRV